MIYLIFLLNIAISWWNCYAIGQVWRTPTSGFDSALKWSAVIQSVAGFSIPIIMLMTWLFTSLVADPTTVPVIWESVMSLWYIGVIIPVVGSGFIIWAHSVRTAWRERSAMNIGIATYNTVAQATNTFSLFSNFGSMLGNVGDLFKGRKLEESLVLIIVGIVILSLASSVFLTMWLINRYANLASAQNIPA